MLLYIYNDIRYICEIDLKNKNICIKSNYLPVIYNIWVHI